MQVSNAGLLICTLSRRAASARSTRRVLDELWWWCDSCQGWHPLMCCQEEQPQMFGEEIAIVGERVMASPVER
jgi:hypothetical protein